MEVRLDTDAESFLLDLERSKHVSQTQLFDDLNDALDYLEANHDVDAACRRHRYQIPDLGTMFGYAIQSTGDDWIILWRYLPDYILVHHFVKSD